MTNPKRERHVKHFGLTNPKVKRKRHSSCDELAKLLNLASRESRSSLPPNSTNRWSGCRRIGLRVGAVARSGCANAQQSTLPLDNLETLRQTLTRLARRRPLQTFRVGGASQAGHPTASQTFSISETLSQQFAENESRQTFQNISQNKIKSKNSSFKHFSKKCRSKRSSCCLCAPPHTHKGTHDRTNANAQLSAYFIYKLTRVCSTVQMPIHAPYSTLLFILRKTRPTSPAAVTACHASTMRTRIKHRDHRFKYFRMYTVRARKFKYHI